MFSQLCLKHPQTALEMSNSSLPLNLYFFKYYKILEKIDNREQFVTIVLFNEWHQTISLKKNSAMIGNMHVKGFKLICVSVSNFHNFFIQINCSNWNNLLLALSFKKKMLQRCIYNPAKYIWRNVLAKIVKGSFRWFQLIPGGCRWLQLVTGFNKYELSFAQNFS